MGVMPPAPPHAEFAVVERMVPVLPPPPQALACVLDGVLFAPTAHVAACEVDGVLLAPPHADVPVAGGILLAPPQVFADGLDVPFN